MNCHSCGNANPERAKFCLECGTPLSARCASCGTELPPAAKFCLECGAQVNAPGSRGLGAPGHVNPPIANTPPATTPPNAQPGLSGARKVVSIIFADLAGSTALHERLDPESVRSFMESYYRAMRGAVETHQGTVVKFLGDGVMAAFGVPRVAENDAGRAVHAGAAMQQAFRELARQSLAAVGEIGLRVGINTGEVVVSADNTDIVGDPVNVAARLQQEARDGEVVIGEATHRLVASLVTLEPLGSLTLKGRAETVKGYRVVSLKRPVGAATAAFVGRAEELGRINAVYDAAVAKPAARLAVLLGSPGLGKSRLIDEFVERHENTVSVLTAQCDAAGGATFAPIAAALREFLGSDSPTQNAALAAAAPGDEVERARIVKGISALLAGKPASTEETFFVIRRLLTGLAAVKPVILIIDDLHWAGSLLLDLVEHLVQWGSGVPLLVLIGARPELRDLRSSLVTPGGFVSDVVTLGGLDAGAAMRLAASVIGAADLPAAVAAKVLATSEGNPLFVGELVRMLVREGALTKEGERWTAGAGLAALEMPPTIHALLAARIERLRPEERSVLECAAVVGRHFSRSAVAALLPQHAADLDARLELLRRSELIEPDSGWFLGEPVLRFHHVLIRDAAYRRLLKGTRAELHERLADWIEAQVGDAAEHDETIGWHLEQAHQLRRELGPLDANGKALGERAAQRLAAAGKRALARDDTPLAANLLGRAIDRLDPDHPNRAELALDWCEALLSAGDVVAAANAIEELGRFLPAPATTEGPISSSRRKPGSPQLETTRECSGNSGFRRNDGRGSLNPRLNAWHTCFVGQLTALTEPQKLQATADAVATAAAELANLGDDAGEAKAHSVHAQALARLGKVGASEAALDKALAAARKAGDRRRANAVLAGAPLAALWGPSPVTRASGRCLDVVRVLRITQGAPAVEAVALSCQGVLEALRGRTEAARRMIASSRKMVEDLGIAHRLFEADVFAGRIDLLEGDALAAEGKLKGAYEGLRELGLGIDAARAGALLARAQLAQGKVAEAQRSSQESEALAGDDLQAAIAWRGVRAEALASRGETKVAVELAQSAVAIAAATDALLDHADARLALATALRATGRAAEADAEERRAIELWEAKGATLLAERARRDGQHPTPVLMPSAPAKAVGRTSAAQRRVRPNAATRNAEQFLAAMTARDFDALTASSSPGLEVIYHPTGSVYGLAQLVAGFRPLFAATNFAVSQEILASFGDSLALVRRGASHAGTETRSGSFGPVSIDTAVLLEVDAQGRASRSEVFDTTRVGDAIARLYERYAELLPAGSSTGGFGPPAGAERERAAAIARSIAALAAPPNMERYASALAAGFAFADHRTVGFASGRGAETLLRGFGSLLELADNVTTRVDDVLAIEPGAILLRWTTSGIDRASGGAFESSFLLLWKFGVDGLVACDETFDVDRVIEAQARFDELTTPVLPPQLFANAATRTADRGTAALGVRDWVGFANLFASGARHFDRRRMVQLESDAKQWLTSFRQIIELTSGPVLQQLLATRGERLALHRMLWRGADGDIGPSEIDWLVIVEVDEHGDHTAVVVYDPDDLAAADAELDARYYAGEGKSYPAHGVLMRGFAAAIAKRDWDPVVAQCSPTFVEYDHRPVALLGTTRSAEAWAQNFRTLIELAPDTIYRVDHLRFGAHGIWSVGTWSGTREGGPYEIAINAVLEMDAHNQVGRADIYDEDAQQLQQARARFEELRGAAPPVHFANVASAMANAVNGSMVAHDWQTFERLFAENFRMSDRRRVVQLELDRSQYVEFTREVADGRTIRCKSRLLATRGERLVLTHPCFEFSDADVGPSEIAFVIINEVDERGLIVGSVRFDVEDLDAAYVELERRWFAGETAAQPFASAWIADYQRAFAARDWEAMTAIMAPELVSRSHRLVSWGTLQGAAALVATMKVQIELAPDTKMRVHHVRSREGGALLEYAWHGTREGGEFENLLVAVVELATDGRARGVDVWEPEKLDEARARFDEIAAEARLHPRASEWVAKFRRAFAARDWDAMAGLAAASEIALNNRLVGWGTLRGPGAWVPTLIELVELAPDVRFRVDHVRTCERGALLECAWQGSRDGGPFETPFLFFVELDDAGQQIRLEVWEREMLDEAVTHFEALSSS